MPGKTEELKDVPGFSQGLRINSALRMLKLGRPICPNSKVEFVRDRDGRQIAKEKGADETNCQTAGGKWWIDCVAKGHNPYVRVRRWETTEPIIEEDDQGRMVVKGEQVFYHEVEEPNTAQVAVTLRINQGQGAKNAVEKKGFKRLSDLGYNEVCQFRNCQKPVTSQGTSRKYGSYCTLEHLQLIAADAEGIMLHQVNSSVNGTDSQKVAQMRERQLREISVGV